MNYDRRRNGLETKIKMLSDTLEKQKKTKAGMPQSLVNKVNEPSKCSTWIFKPNLLINDFIFTSIPIQRTFVKKKNIGFFSTGIVQRQY